MIIYQPSHYLLITSEGTIPITEAEFNSYKNSDRLKVPYINDKYELVYVIK